MVRKPKSLLNDWIYPFSWMLSQIVLTILIAIPALVCEIAKRRYYQFKYGVVSFSRVEIYLFVVSTAYLVSYAVLKYFTNIPDLMGFCQIGYVATLALPLFIPPLARRLDMI